MKVSFPYVQFPGVEIPDESLLGVFALPEQGQPAREGDIVGESVCHPIGTRPLREIAREKRSILIVCDDVSRPTPASRIIPSVLRELDAAGVSEECVEIMMALGTHRPMTGDEMREKVGSEVFDRFPVHNHEWDKPDELTRIGKTDQGVDVWMNKRVVDADCVIGIGRIMPIDICGFTGGGKILVPGCCGEHTLDEMHWIRVDTSDEEVVGVRDNPVRASIDAMARIAGLEFIVNIVMDRNKNILDCVSGDLVEAHREGCRRAREYHSIHVPEKADIVIVDGCPFDIEFWQVNKAVDTAGLVVRDGGVVICVSPCYEGLSCTHGETILKYGYRRREEIKQLVSNGAIRPKVVGVHMIQVSNVSAEKAHMILVTDGIPREDVEKVGLKYSSTLDEALDEAFRMVGADAKVAVLRGASEMLPVIAQ